jgi:hypothetical protein
MRRSVTLCVALLALAGAASACRSAGDPGGRRAVAAGEEFTLARGQTAAVDGGALTVYFAGVPHDSRCPINVECIAAGNAVVRLELSDGGSEVVELNTTVGAKEADHAGYTVQLVALRPGTTVGRRIRQGMYRAVLRATRG